MHLVITGDANEESGVAEVVYGLSGPTERYFRSKDYGVGLLGIGVVLMCRNPELNFHRRIRFARKEKTLYMDVMLDLKQMQPAEHERRKQIILERLMEEIPAVVSKYSIADFDEARFVDDLKSWFKKNGATPDAPPKKL